MEKENLTDSQFKELSMIKHFGETWNFKQRLKRITLNNEGGFAEKLITEIEREKYR